MFLTESSHTLVEAYAAVGEGISQRKVTSGSCSIGASLQEEGASDRRTLSSLDSFCLYKGITAPR